MQKEASVEETKLEIEHEEVAADEHNSVAELCQWSNSEVMELQGVYQSVKYFKKLNTRIDTFANKKGIKSGLLLDSLLEEKHDNLTRSINSNEGEQESRPTTRVVSRDVTRATLALGEAELLRNQKPEDLSQLEQLISFKSILLKFLGNFLIPNYKRERTSTYHSVLLKFVNQEMSNAHIDQHKWNSVY